MALGFLSCNQPWQTVRRISLHGDPERKRYTPNEVFTGIHFFVKRGQKPIKRVAFIRFCINPHRILPGIGLLGCEGSLWQRLQGGNIREACPATNDKSGHRFSTRPAPQRVTKISLEFETLGMCFQRYLFFRNRQTRLLRIFAGTPPEITSEYRQSLSGVHLYLLYLRPDCLSAS